MLRLILKFHSLITDAVEHGVSMEKIRKLSVKEDLAYMGRVPNETYVQEFEKIEQRMEEEIKALVEEVK